MIIYKIENKINGKVYIGQTAKTLTQRIATHIRTNKTYIQRALNKYGLEPFAIMIIDKTDAREDLNEKEIYWIKFYNCRAPRGYNCTAGGEGANGYKHTEKDRERNKLIRLGIKHSEETKQKMSIAQTGKKLSAEHKRNLSIAKTGVLFSGEHKRRLSESHKGKQLRLGTHHSEETKAKLRNRVVSEETKAKLREANIGKKHSEETKRKISEGNKGKILSKETRAKIKDSWVIRKQKMAIKTEIGLCA